jgi:hypothetical protein
MKIGTASQRSPEPEGNGNRRFVIEAAAAECRMNTERPLNGFSLAVTFEGEFSGVTRSYAGKGVARYAW